MDRQDVCRRRLSDVSKVSQQMAYSILTLRSRATSSCALGLLDNRQKVPEMPSCLCCSGGNPRYRTLGCCGGGHFRFESKKSNVTNQFLSSYFNNHLSGEKISRRCLSQTISPVPGTFSRAGKPNELPAPRLVEWVSQAISKRFWGNCSP